MTESATPWGPPPSTTVSRPADAPSDAVPGTPTEAPFGSGSGAPFGSGSGTPFGSGSGPSSPARRTPPRAGRGWLLGLVATVLSVAVVVGTFQAAGALWRAGDERAAEERVADRQAEIDARLEAENRPELRDVAPVSLLGPTWEPGADTYTMAFPHWPFAFRTPGPWNCFRGGYDPIPDAEVWGCTENMNYDTPPRVGVLLWECPTSCTEDEQQAMVEAWLDDPEAAVAADGLPSVYVETEANERDNYQLDISYFVGEPSAPGGPLRWHIGIYAEAADDATREDVLKIVNDIISQTS